MEEELAFRLETLNETYQEYYDLHSPWNDESYIVKMAWYTRLKFLIYEHIHKRILKRLIVSLAREISYTTSLPMMITF